MHLSVKGESVPAMGLGTWAMVGQRCTAAVEGALDLGYRLIDTAQDYDNEADVGRGITRSGVNREEVFLVTKVRPSNFLYETTIRSTHESLRKLSTEYVDLLLMHWPNPQVPLEETLAAMSRLQREGKIRHIGVSNFSPLLVDEAYRSADIFCNQIEFHPYLSQEKLIAQSKNKGHLLIAYCPLAKGSVSGDPVLAKIAEAHHKTSSQIALRWIFQQGLLPIPKASSDGHQGENYAIFDFELSDEEMVVISGLDEGLRLDPVSIYTEG
jgi:diketogulonate reductase-like aldo/keto reductase